MTGRRSTAVLPALGLVLGLASTLLVACGGDKKVCNQPEVIELTLEAIPPVNLNHHGKSSPTLLRLYQLSDRANAEMAGFEQIWENDKGVLGSALIGEPIERFVYAEHPELQPVERDPKANYLVGIANFRSREGFAWRAVIGLPPPNPCPEPPAKPLRVRMTMQGYRLTWQANFRPPSARPCFEGDPECATGEEGAGDGAPVLGKEIEGERGDGSDEGADDGVELAPLAPDDP